jgi:AcrR family transcriptional regulator
MCTPVNIACVNASQRNSAAGRASYHHGDLRNALIEAGVNLAERGGPDAVGVRAAAREVGVTPTAAYRHFTNAEELQDAVKDYCLGAFVDAMRAELAALSKSGDAREDALQRLTAIGRGYVKVGLADPGLFRTCFGEHGTAARHGVPAANAPAFSMLGDALDVLVNEGGLPAERRPLAEYAAWAGVHGLVRLIIDGPLADLPPDARDALIERTLTMIVNGL